MSRIEEAWKITRSMERGDPQPTAFAIPKETMDIILACGDLSPASNFATELDNRLVVRHRPF